MVNTLQIRTREGSLSDIHIARCDCPSCDGLGQLYGDETGMIDLLWECPSCEGLGYTEASSHAEQAYQAYLNDLYREVVRDMPALQHKTVAA